MKKTMTAVLMATIAIVTVSMSSCGGKTEKVPFDNGDSTEVGINHDNTIYGVCGDGTAMNTLQLITDLGDTIVLDLTYAQENNQVFGGLQVGDRMVVTPNAKRDGAIIVVNQAALLGNWVMPNPLDGSSEVGIRIKEGGICEGIEQSSLDYKTWRIVNGKLELVAVREGGAEEEEVTLYEMKSLTPDSLILKDADDLLEYERQKEHKNEVNIKLEEASEEDYKI